MYKKKFQKNFYTYKKSFTNSKFSFFQLGGDRMGKQNELQRSIKSRHMFMISLGGVIGTGFFLSTGNIMHNAGPFGTLLAYAVGGLTMFLVMLCLGELAVYNPTSGSFHEYATRYISPGVGFSVGIIYWLNWVVTVGSEFTAVGLLMQRWFPESPVWVWSVIFGVTIFVFNALSVKFFAESEFWFAGLKIIIVIIFIFLGAAAIFGIVPVTGHEHAPLLSNFTGEGGLLPNGFAPILIAMVSISFAFSGTELIGITAGESENPSRDIPRSIKNIVWRTLFFFIGAIIVLGALLPWEDSSVSKSPFVTVFDMLGIPYAADIMNFVIITALLSVANSGLYASTRMLWSLSKEKMVPKALGTINKRGVPMNALIVCMLISCLSLLSSIIAPTTVYVMLVAVAGFGVVVGWMGIVVSQFMFRRQYLKEGGKLEDLKFRVKLYPLVPILAFLLCLGATLGLLLDPEQRSVLYFGVPAMIACYFWYHIQKKIADKREARLSETVEEK